MVGGAGGRFCRRGGEVLLEHLAEGAQARAEALVGREVAETGHLGVARAADEAGQAGLGADAPRHASGRPHGRTWAGDVGTGDDRLGDPHLGLAAGQRSGDVADIDDVAILPHQHLAGADQTYTQQRTHVVGHLLAHEGLGNDDVVGVATFECEDRGDAFDLGDGVAERQLVLVIDVDDQHFFHAFLLWYILMNFIREQAYNISIKSI